MNKPTKKFGSPIAYGRTAEIYAWHNDQVLKLFYDWFDPDDIQYELQIARAVQACGLPVPRVGEIIRVNGRNGLTYQRIGGVSMLEMLSRKPWNTFSYARVMAEMHAQMHASAIQADIPSLRQRITYKVNHAEALASDQRMKILTLLDTMPVGNRLCHGDYHPGNILVTRQGKVIIDWIDSTLGNPLADLARSTIIAIGAIETNQIKSPFMKLLIRIFHKGYIHRYFSLQPGGEAEYSRWLPIIAAARLSENIPELEAWLVGQVKNGIMKYSPA
jgi:uncharacterized protein (TIGR02172 family)